MYTGTDRHHYLSPSRVWTFRVPFTKFTGPDAITSTEPTSPPDTPDHRPLNRTQTSIQMKTLQKVIVYNTIVLVALFLILEIFTRASRLFTPNNFYEEVNRYGEVINLREPNSKSLNKHEQENMVEYNNLGFHDVMHEADDTAKPNVAYFGDSYVEATQLRTEDMFSTRVGKAVADSLDIYNFGVSGSGTANQYHLYHHLLEKGRRIDYVYVVFYPGNDFKDNNPRVKTHPNFTLVADSLGNITQINRRQYGFLQRAARELRKYSAFINWVYETMYRRKRIEILKQPETVAVANEPAQAGRKPYRNDESVETEVDSAMLSGLSRIVDRWAQEAGRDRFRMMVIDAARFRATTANFRAWEDTLKALGVPLVAVDVPREGHYYMHEKLDSNGNRIWKNYNYGHFNEMGHRLWTDVALRDLRNAGWR